MQCVELCAARVELSAAVVSVLMCLPINIII